MADYAWLYVLLALLVGIVTVVCAVCSCIGCCCATFYSACWPKVRRRIVTSELKLEQEVAIEQVLRRNHSTAAVFDSSVVHETTEAVSFREIELKEVQNGGASTDDIR
jgi:hypothetical protein